MPQVKKIKLVAQTVTRGTRLERIVQETERSIFAEITSITQNEFYQASAAGLTAEGKAVGGAFEYKGEKILELNSQRYAIYRTYQVPGSKKMELYYSYEVGPATKPATTSTVTITGGTGA